MGWNSGSSLLTEIWHEIKDLLPDKINNTGYSIKTVALTKLMVLFSNYDCDTLYE